MVLQGSIPCTPPNNYQLKTTTMKISKETINTMLAVIIKEKLSASVPAERFEGKLILFEHDGTKIWDMTRDESDSIDVDIEYYAESIIKEFTNLNIQ
jgi:predicted oxidoreductase (fatty acid repression mutant protein)